MLGWPTGSSFIYICVPTYTHNTRAHSCTQWNKQGWWGGGPYTGVLSDTPTECVTQCANIPSLHETNTRHHANHVLSRICETKHDTYHLYLGATFFHNYTLKQCKVCLHWSYLIMPKLIVFITSIYLPEYCTSFTVSQDLLCGHLHDFVSHRWIKGNIEGMEIQKMILNVCLGSKLMYSPPSTAMHYHT